MNGLAGPGAGARAVLVFVRAPRLGEVKTRLAAELGEAAALRVYRRLAEDTMREVVAMHAVELRVHYAPAGTDEEVSAWLGEGPCYLPQCDGDLGERMESGFTQAFAAGYGSVVVVGSDIPGVTAALLADAFFALDRSEAVLGPAEDGGYYLLGLRTSIPGIFDGIPWSTPEVLPLTLERLRTAGIRPFLLPTLRDVDEMDDLPAGWREWAAAEPSAHFVRIPPCTTTLHQNRRTR